MHFSNWQNKLTYLWVLFLLIVGILTAVLWMNQRIHIQANIFALLPDAEQNVSLQNTQRYMGDQLNQKVFVVLDAKDAQSLDQATQLITQAVKHTDVLKPIQHQFDADQFGQTLFKHRVGLLSQADIDLLKDKDYASLTEHSVLQFSSPGIPITATLLKQDPLLLFPRYLMGLSELQTQNNIRLEQGFATIHDDKGFSRLIVLELKNSPYNIDDQEKTMQWIATQKQALSDLSVQSHWTGTLIFASFGTQSAQNEISTIGLGSSLGLIFLVWFGFRSLRPMLTEFIAVSSGSLVAFFITHLIFNEIHLMTLVFGASLIGVCVDFSFYFMALQSQHRQHDGFSILKPLLPSLFMGLMTTIVAYLALSFSPFPGFRQIAVFSMVGLGAAWVTSILLLPRLPALNAEPALKRLAWIGAVRTKFQQKKTVRYGAILFIVMTGFWGVIHLSVNDDVRNLQSMNDQLKQEDRYVRERFVQPQTTDYFIIEGKNTDQLEQNLITTLKTLKTKGDVENFQALGQWLPTAQQQEDNKKQLMNLSPTVLEGYARATNIPINDLLAWQKQLYNQPILNVADMQTHPLFFLQQNKNVRLVLVQGKPSVLKALQTSQVHYQQPIQTLSDMFKDHRQQATKLLIYALLGLAIGLGVIYGLSAIVPLMLPVSMALLTTFAVQSFLGVEINLFSLMGTFLILGIGVDYAIFYRHGHDHSKVVGMALFLCMLSTLLGFGLLSFSNTYAIHCFGLTVLLGVIFSFVYATLFTVSDHHHQILKSLKKG
ncbi:MMPL family transporter [Acinetobacter rathckeae]|uniref:MMPL family transporter n=1 Tax=Acinetobacter rathckeae TaxID=2605272 RepID=UPI0018A28DFC|nr:hypothetical protein [Acinetobacter rathckeae]MBF7687799.1 acyl-sn-glycerol-3-phosphate acyltransferase [Acinetobacter rathckeae]MBF7687978.1 acyl-sn-glycerol-3-phosphate acyltransferase [Acinetobacter rathckeae]MBF7695968.1 acyl-sn-glycerol-3-phosphate acyltransferase [Acinetobacter rathckeae]